MTEQHDARDEEMVESKRGTLKRRGIIAGAAALAATALASRTIQDVSAANGDPLLIGGSAGGSGAAQTGTAITWLNTTPAPASGPTLRVTTAFPGTPDAGKDGMQGFTTGANNTGAFGRNNDLNGVGTWGEAPNGTGAFGDSTNGSGVAGNSTSGSGVYGQSTSGNGVYGVSTGGLYGVRGDAGPGAGSAGLLGYSNQPGGVAFGTVIAAPATTAGFFGGRVVVNGDFAVTGNKNAAVKDSAGNLRLMYCVEATESWFEDFGIGTLTNGQADVQIEPIFGSLVSTSDYHVFLAEYGDFHLHVSQRTATGFSVATTSGTGAGGGSGSFSWRIVAKRADVKAERLAKTSLPVLNMPNGTGDRPTLPTPRPLSSSGAPQPAANPPSSLPTRVPDSRPASTGTTTDTVNPTSSPSISPAPLPPPRP